MPTLTPLSQQRLATCHPDLQRVVSLASSRFPFEVLCGHRNQADQDAAVAAGRSKTPWPTSRHNATPSEAVDLAPLPIDWTNTARFAAMAAVVKQCAAELGVAIQWGQDLWGWDGDHFQLRRHA